MKVLVSGAHGLIGSAAIEDLSNDGHAVVTLDRPTSSGSSTSTGSVKWDPAKGEINLDALGAEGPYDAVLHLAGAGIGDRRWTSSRKREIVDSRVRSTELLCESLERLDEKPSVLVSASAIGIYGDRGGEVLTEDSAPGTGFLADVCIKWEKASERAIRAGMRVVNLRSGIVLSSKGGALARQLPLFRLGLGGKLGNGHQYFSWITLADEIAIIRSALEDSRISGPMNAVAPGSVTNAAFTRELGKALHRPALFAVPKVALSVVFGPEMTAEMLLAGQHVEPAKLVSAGFRFRSPDLQQALESVL